MTPVLLAEFHGAVYLFIGAYRDSVLVVAAFIRSVHPCRSAAYASVGYNLDTAHMYLFISVGSLVIPSEIRILSYQIPYIIHSDFLSEAFFGRFNIVVVIVYGVDVSHVADCHYSLRKQQFSQVHDSVYHLLPRFFRQYLSYKVTGVLTENAGRLSVFVSVNLSAGGIFCVSGYSRQLQSFAVYRPYVRTGAQQFHREVFCSFVQIPSGRGSVFREFLLVISPALNPLAFFFVFGRLSDNLRQFFDRADCRWQTGNFLGAVG